MKTGTVYALSCLDGPIVYVGATYSDVRERIKIHWKQIRLTNPIYIWMRQLKQRDDLRINVLSTVCDDYETPRKQCQLWRLESDLIKKAAADLLQSHHVLSLNVSQSPYRLLSPECGCKFRHIQVAENISPYELVRKNTLVEDVD